MDIKQEWYKIYQLTQTTSPTNPPLGTTPQGTPLSTALLHGIMPGRGPTAYVYIYIYVIITSSNFKIADITSVTSVSLPGMHYFSDAIDIIGMIISALLPISNCIQLNFSDSTRLTFYDLIWLPLHVFYFWFNSKHANPIRVKLQGVQHRL